MLAALEVASVVGETSSLEVVSRAARLGRGRVLRTLERAVDARLVTRVAGAPGHYRFAHAMIRDVLYQGLSAKRVASLHGRAGQPIEGLFGDADEHLPAIAVHYLRAVPRGGAARALRHAQRAGERAMALLAWEEAAGHFERALSVLDLEPAPADVDRRCDLHLSLAHACVRAGLTEAARQAFLAAAATGNGCPASRPTTEVLARWFGLVHSVVSFAV